jgi:hypothetical protein
MPAYCIVITKKTKKLGFTFLHSTLSKPRLKSRASVSIIILKNKRQHKTQQNPKKPKSQKLLMIQESK